MALAPLIPVQLSQIFCRKNGLPLQYPPPSSITQAVSLGPPMIGTRAGKAVTEGNPLMSGMFVSDGM